MVLQKNIKEIAEYFNEIFRLYGQKIMVENAELIDFFKIGSFGTACSEVIIRSSYVRC